MSVDQTMRILVDAYNAKDLDRFLGCWWESARIYRQGEDEPLYEGLERLREDYGKAFREHPGLKADILERVTHGNWVVDKERISGKRDGSSYEALVLYQLEDGRIRNAWIAT